MMDEQLSEFGIKAENNLEEVEGDENLEETKDDVILRRVDDKFNKASTEIRVKKREDRKSSVHDEEYSEGYERSFALKNFLNQNALFSRIRDIEKNGVLTVTVTDNYEKCGLSNGEAFKDHDLQRRESPELEVSVNHFNREQEDQRWSDNDDDNGDDDDYFNPMADCVILEEGEECLQFSDDRPDEHVDETQPDPTVSAVNGNYLSVTALKNTPVSRRKKRVPSRVSNDETDEDPCQVIWSDPNENGSCRVCRGHCPGPRCRKCRAVEVQGRKRYVCLLCDKTINHMGNFGQHVRSHVSPICHLCHKTFDTLKKLEQHMYFHRKKLGSPMKKRRKQKTPIKIEASNDENEDDNIGEYFSNENSSSPHYETNGDICELLQVDILTKSDEFISNGKDIVHDNDDDDNDVVDDDDDDDEVGEGERAFRLTDVKDMDEHDINEQEDAIDLSMSTGHGEEIHQCEYCHGINCPPHKCLKSKVETVEDRTIYECLICGKVIVNHKGNFKQHVRSHTDFSCKVCGKKFNDAIRLKKHAEIHTKEKSYTCDVCSKKFRVLHHLKMHKERAHIREKKYSCTNCDRVFPTRGELMSHIRWSHMGPERPFECELCQKTFAYKNNLKIHMRIHTNDKPYACEVCGRAFTQSSSLKMHMTVHAFNHNVFKCEACDKSFPYASNLKLHVKSVHSGLNPARRKSTTCACHLCGLGFTHRNSLKAHMRTAHSFYDYATLEQQNEKMKISQSQVDPDVKLTSRKDNKHRPHICPTCGKGFTQRGSLKTHMRVLHNSDLIAASDTKHAFPYLASLLPPAISLQLQPPSPSILPPTSPPAPLPPSPPPSDLTNNNYNQSQLLKCGVCGSMFAHYEHLESHICIHSV